MAFLSETDFTAKSILSEFSSSGYDSEPDLMKGDLCLELLKNELEVDDDYLVDDPSTNPKIKQAMIYFVMCEMATDRLGLSLIMHINEIQVDPWEVRLSAWRKAYESYKQSINTSDFYDADNMPDDVVENSGNVKQWMAF